MADHPVNTREPADARGERTGCSPGEALFVWIVLSWVGVAYVDALSPWQAAALLSGTLAWVGWSWGRPWFAMGCVALLIALAAGHDGRSDALVWYQVSACLAVVIGPAIVFGPSPEHLLPAVVSLLLAAVLIPFFAKAREQQRIAAVQAYQTEALKDWVQQLPEPAVAQSLAVPSGPATLRLSPAGRGFAVRCGLSAGAREGALALVSCGSSDRWVLELQANGTAAFAVSVGGCTVRVASPVRIDDARQHRLMAIVDLARSAAVLYVDGEPPLRADGLPLMDSITGPVEACDASDDRTRCAASIAVIRLAYEGQ